MGISLQNEELFYSAFSKIPMKYVTGNYYTIGPPVCGKKRIVREKDDESTVVGWIIAK